MRQRRQGGWWRTAGLAVPMAKSPVLQFSRGWPAASDYHKLNPAKARKLPEHSKKGSTT